MAPAPFIPAPPRKYRKRQPLTGGLTFALTLVGVGYEVDEYVRLEFNQPINIDNLVPDAFTVSDGNTSNKYTGTSALLVSPTVVQIDLMYVEATQDQGVLLWATAGNGIISSSTGADWPGVSARPI
jgi:hypothetical protein